MSSSSVTTAVQLASISTAFIASGGIAALSLFDVPELQSQPASRSLPSIRWLFSRGSHIFPQAAFLSSAGFAYLAYEALPRSHRALTRLAYVGSNGSKVNGLLLAAALTISIGPFTSLMIPTNFTLIKMNEERGGKRSKRSAEENSTAQAGSRSATDSVNSSGEGSEFTDLSVPQTKTERDSSREEDEKVRELLQQFGLMNGVRAVLMGAGGLSLEALLMMSITASTKSRSEARTQASSFRSGQEKVLGRCLMLGELQAEYVYTIDDLFVFFLVPSFAKLLTIASNIRKPSAAEPNQASAQSPSSAPNFDRSCACNSQAHDSLSMVLARVADYFFPSTQSEQPLLNYIDDGRRESPAVSDRSDRQNPGRRPQEGLQPDMNAQEDVESLDPDAYRPPYLHAMLAGGIGGTAGDMLMHSLDTVKTRQQGDPHMPPKYTSMGNTYYTILRQEGVQRGLYGGVAPAFLGSFGGTLIFFGCYEWSKRYMIDHGVTPSLAYLCAGFCSDLAASPLYVPTEVLKTRLQLQGRFNNPYFTSGFNYRSTFHALRTIYTTEGFAELFSGYKATLFRDLPFSALQFTFYEQEQKIAKQWVGSGQEIGLTLEILTGASAGGMAGVLTCPMDVVKTRIQTELDPEQAAAARQMRKAKKAALPGGASTAPATSPALSNSGQATHRPSPSSQSSSTTAPKTQKLPISTSGPSTALKHHGQVPLDTESVVKALRIIYRTEGLAGWFRGVGPRFVWTSVQSGTMLLVYQKLLRWFDARAAGDLDDEGLRGATLSS